MKKNTFLRFTSIFLLFLISFKINAQSLDVYKNKYPNEDVITTFLSKHIEVQEIKNTLKIREQVKKINYYLTNQSLSTANEQVSYNTFGPIAFIEAYTTNLIQENSKKKYVREFKDKNILINGIFFNDQKEKFFSFPNVHKGSTTHLNYIKEIKDPHFLPSYIISTRNPIEKIFLSVSFPNNVEIDYKTFNLDTINSSFEKIKEANKTTYKWTLTKIPKRNRHYDFSPLYYVPQVIIYIKSHTKKNGIRKTILSNPNDLYTWYRSLISNINKSDQSKLKAITLELIKGINNEEEKVKRIYYFVQDKINYIAFEDGLNGFIPRDANDVFLKKYGDCKDMANILNEMLFYAEIPSYLTWIGTRDRPYKYNEVPTPVTDNHMITTIKLKDTFIFLDATAKYLPLYYPSPFIQGKEALIGFNENQFKIKKVPEIEPSKNKAAIISYLKYVNNTLEGSHKIVLNGYEKFKMLHRIQNKSKKDLTFLQSALKLGTKKTKFDSILYKNIEIEVDNLLITFISTTPDYGKLFDNKIYIKPNLDYHLKKEIVKNEKKLFDKKIDFKFQKYFKTTIEIPKLYILDYLPKDVSYDNVFFNFYINYNLSSDKKQIIIEKGITVNTLKINPQKIEQWNSFIKLLNTANKQHIIFKKEEL